MKIKLSHGGGGKETHSLVHDIIEKHLGNAILNQMEDAAILRCSDSIAFTTDSFVVKPLFFPGGDIGKLSVCGTLNDLAVMGAIPEYISLSLIIEEGMDLEELERIIKSIASECERNSVDVVCGDTKVVEKGSGDRLFINTAGIGRVRKGARLSMANVKPGDAVLVNGFLGEHGIALLGARNELNFSSPVESDCASLTSLVQRMLDTDCEVHAIRDATRGGLAAVVNEMGRASGVTVVLKENRIPISKEVLSACDLLGLNPLELANEGKLILTVPEAQAETLLAAMKSDPLGKDSAVIGVVERMNRFPATLETGLGVQRIFEMPKGELLPRIC